MVDVLSVYFREDKSMDAFTGFESTPAIFIACRTTGP